LRLRLGGADDARRDPGPRRLRLLPRLRGRTAAPGRQGVPDLRWHEPDPADHGGEGTAGPPVRQPSVITIGAPAALHAAADPLGDVRWADEAGLEAVWFVDHHQGWFPRGVDGGVLGDPHATLDPFPLMGAAAA